MKPKWIFLRSKSDSEKRKTSKQEEGNKIRIKPDGEIIFL